MTFNKDTILIGIDFSINKPGVCVYANNKYIFYGWPYGISENVKNIFRNSNVNIIDRTDNKIKGDDVSQQMRYQVSNAIYLSKVMIDSLKPYLGNNTYLAFEGLSYGSSGDIILQLGGYKYIIMNELSKYMPLDNMFTYAPTTVKKTAGCSKKGLGKHAMIDSFIQTSENNSLKSGLIKDKESFMKKGNLNYIDGLDDFVDSYFVLQTLREKEF